MTAVKRKGEDVPATKSTRDEGATASKKAANEYPFKVDPFQDEAIRCLERGESVLLKLKMGNRTKKKAEETVGTDGFLPLEGNTVNQVQSIPIKKQAQGKDPMVGEKNKPTVLYIGHIPHGFFEDQMRGFFRQFGAIKHLRISRNRKTGKAKHYGFIEFESPAVAQIVADCMHNYLLFEHILQVQLVPPEKIHPQLWNGSNRKFKLLKWQRIQMKHHNRDRTAEEQDHLMKAILKKDAKRRKKIEAAGIEYDYPDITDGLPPAPKKIKFLDDQE